MPRIELADRIRNLPPYPFAAIDQARAKAKAEGKDIISLGIGDPDLPTPAFIVEAAREAALDPRTHRYPDYTGRLDYREAAARYMNRRFGAAFDAATEVLALIGSKEGIAHIPLAYINPGDVALVPNPGYPVYAVATNFCGGIVHDMPLRAEHNFTPDLAAIPTEWARRSKLMFLNYPNNPTGAVVSADFLRQAVAFCREFDILLVYDNAYSELAFEGYRPMSIFEIEGARDIAIEMHSLSKSFNMTGWRIGWACGDAAYVGGLGQVKTNVDSGAFDAIQIAGIAALDRHDDPVVRANYEIYGHRRRACEARLREMGIEFLKSPATFYVWCRVPTDETSAAFVSRVLETTGVVFTPGTAFGRAGEGWFRIALTVDEARMTEALARVEKLLA